MAATAFEITGLGPGTVTGTCELRESISPAPGFPEEPAGGGLSNNLFKVDQDLIFRVDWTEFAPGAIFLAGGQWRMEAVLEQIGGAVSNQSSAVASVGGGVYQVDMTFAGGTLSTGLYRALVTIQWFTGGGTAGPLAGFCDLGVIRVYNEP